MQVTQGWKDAVSGLMAFSTAERADIEKLAALAQATPADLLVVTAGVYFSRGNMAQAEDYYTRAMLLEPGYDFLLDYFKAVRMVMETDRYDDALRLLREIERRGGVQAKMAKEAADKLIKQVERESPFQREYADSLK